MAGASTGNTQPASNTFQNNGGGMFFNQNKPGNGGGNSGAPAAPGRPNVFGQAAGDLRQAGNVAGRVAGYQPQNVTAGNLNVQGFMNPYTQQVTNRTMQQLGQQRAGAINTLDAQASQAGAFGGSRHGVALGETMGQYADAQADALAGLNMQGFTQAQNAAMQAAQGNQQAGLAGAGLRLNAAGTLGNLSNLGFGQGQQVLNQQNMQGGMMQGMNQTIIDAGKGNWQGFTGQPAQSLAMLLGGSQIPTGNTQTGTQSYKPGLFDYLSLGFLGAPGK